MNLLIGSGNQMENKTEKLAGTIIYCLKKNFITFFFDL